MEIALSVKRGGNRVQSRHGSRWRIIFWTAPRDIALNVNGIAGLDTMRANRLRFDEPPRVIYRHPDRQGCHWTKRPGEHYCSVHIPRMR
jgi:hypothetical protein